MVHFQAGEHIIRQGEEGSDLFVVDEGMAYAQLKISEKESNQLPQPTPF